MKRTFQAGKLQPVSEHLAWLKTIHEDFTYIREYCSVPGFVDTLFDELREILAFGTLTQLQASRANELSAVCHDYIARATEIVNSGLFALED